LCESRGGVESCLSGRSSIHTVYKPISFSAQFVWAELHLFERSQHWLQCLETYSQKSNDFDLENGAAAEAVAAVAAVAAAVVVVVAAVAAVAAVVAAAAVVCLCEPVAAACPSTV